MISPKDIADMFAELEIYLIQSFKRNLKRHKDWEKDEGFEWSAWQAEKLRELNIFRRQNKTIAKNFISHILPQTRQMLIEQYKEGSDTTPSFFGINERRLNALIDEMLTIEQDVTKAALRNVDDAYRQTVLKAAAARNSGTMTLYQAVDMASKEFLSKGINCVQYKDGRRVNIVSYAEMALRTNATRSRLYGQRAKMKEMGIDTVIISQYGGCSPTCLPWQGKVYIDDVFIDFEGKKGVSWGVSSNGNTYMLLSHAMKNGLFHPNCRHNARIYREGITRIPRPLDKDTVNKNYALEQQQHALERDVRKAKRLEEGTLDEEKKKEYTAYRKYAQKKLREFIAEHDDVLRRDLWREKVWPDVRPTEHEKNTEYIEKCPVDFGYIYSPEYRKKFNNITDNSDVNNLLYKKALDMLEHRHNTPYEDIHLISYGKSEVVASNTYSKTPYTVESHITIENAVKRSVANDLIGIHNHPSNLPPSGGDIAVAFDRKYKIGVIACHNGDIYIYRQKKEINSRIYDLAVEKYLKRGYNIYAAYDEALNDLKERYGVSWTKIEK